MADHLLIGILFGIASGIVALIIIASVMLRRFEVARHVEPARVHRTLADLQASSRRAEHTIRRDIDGTRRELEMATRESRDESAASARALRDEIAGGLRGVSDSFARGLRDMGSLQERQTESLAGRLAELTETAVDALRDHPLPALSRMAEAQERHLGALAAELRSLADTAGARLDDVRLLLDERLRQIQTESRDSLDRLRADATSDAKALRNDMLESLQAHTDARVDSIVEQRLGESFSLVGERLEQVHRGLGDVQTFAAGLSNIQRALANVRLGAGTTRGGPAPAAEAEPRPRTARRKLKTMPADIGHETVEAPRALTG